MMKIFLILLTFYSAHTAPTDIENFLEKYGYINNQPSSNDTSKRITDTNAALKTFQEYYKILPADGTLNEETQKLIETPRCGVKDYPLTPYLNYGRPHGKWNKTTLTWYFSLANYDAQQVAEKVFETWANISVLKFQHVTSDPDILISFADGPIQHSYDPRCMGPGDCNSDFDGRGSILAHGFHPTNHGSCKEIHLDKSEHWYYGFDETPDGQQSLFITLLHEAGHTFGLTHSRDKTAIMHAYANDNNRIPTVDDMWAIQSLYGRTPTIPTILRNNTVSSTPTTPAAPAITPTVYSARPTTQKVSTQKVPTVSTFELCAVRAKINTFLIANHRLYIFYKKYFWFIDLKTMHYSKESKLITDYLTFLPDTFEEISHIFRRPSGDVVIVANDLFYIMKIPGLTVNVDFNGLPVTNLGLPKNMKINSIFNTYSGQTYIFYDDSLYIELDECTLKAKEHGLIAEKFPGLPLKASRAFRYLNGMLYFFYDDYYAEYSEFSNTLIQAKNFDLSVFKINCGVIERIKILLAKLIE